MNDSPILTAAIAAGVALLVAVVAAIVQSRDNYLQAVTAERSKWIDKLRSNISNLSGMVRTFSYQNQANTIAFNSPEYVSALDDINKVVSLIQLQLNPNGTVDKNILQLIVWLPILSQSERGHFQLVQGDRLLVAHAQWLLKDEWEKVKREADIFGILRSNREQERRNADHLNFCELNDIRSFIEGAGTGSRGD